jgi:hypothetical protein
MSESRSAGSAAGGLTGDSVAELVGAPTGRGARLDSRGVPVVYGGAAVASTTVGIGD